MTGHENEDAADRQPRVAAVLTSHNRVATTLRALEGLEGQHTSAQLDLVMVDDGSADGTAESVRAAFPQVRLLRGDGTLYWNRGMHRAWQVALGGKYDYYLWLNDDTSLDPDALQQLLDVAETLGRPSIIVGCTRSKDGHLTYGGYVRDHPRLRPLHFRRVQVGTAPREVDTMNGNCVLISADVANVVGNLDPAFIHGMGDFDYGLRATKLGIPIIVAPGFIGECDRNAPTTVYRDPAVSFRTRIRTFLGPKGLPPGAWFTFTRRHTGPLWPVLFALPYVKFFVAALWIEATSHPSR